MIKEIPFYLSLLFAIFDSGVYGVCPDDSLLAPCSCNDDEHIICAGDKPINFCEMFAKLAKKLPDNKKDYEMFILSNSAVEEIPENCFDDIYFREIKIQNSLNLKKIHSNAFKGTDQLTERFKFINSPKFESNPVTHLFDILNKFKKLDAISISNIGLKEIPANAFKAESVVWVWINGLGFDKIGEKAFFNLNSLTEIHITNTSITEIPKNLFVFSKKAEIPLEIVMYNNQKLTKLNEQAFSESGRPVLLDFSGQRFGSEVFAKQMPVLDEKVFSQFFKVNELNKIELTALDFDCKNCQNFWLKKNPKLLERLVNVKCSDGKNVNDSSTFTNCK